MTIGDSIKGKVELSCSNREVPSRGAHEAQNVVVAHALPSRKPTKSVDRGFDHGCSFRLLGKEDRIVVYFTSSRRGVGGLLSVRMILRDSRVWIGEEGCVDGLNTYRKELASVLGRKMLACRRFLSLKTALSISRPSTS
ncbi:hypothetical protein NL676_031827 [Syzygium grande]|nr:hypothetical protein NL676_031827 [Syzygium grande]